MKQLILMIVLTSLGTFGAVFRPFWGVAVYYLFATLRPHYLWEWILPRNVQWSRYVSLATIAVAVAASMGVIPAGPPRDGGIPRRFGRSQVLIYAFAAWVCVTYITARHQESAYDYIIEYLKIFAMMAASMVLLHSVDELYFLLVECVLALCYIAVEVNDLYFRAGALRIYHEGYCGLDNNGAGLMLGMAVPPCILLWNHIEGRWRWFFLGLVPATIHAVLMTYSRGAMLSLLVVCPLIVLRCRRRLQILAMGAVLFVGVIPVLAGEQIRARFLTLEHNDTDGSANLRRQSWAAAWNMALDNPIFGVGIRNSNLYSYQYGADMEGRTIHSQYLQIAADNGFVGLGLYLAMLGSVALDLRFCRRVVRGREDPESRRIFLVATGIETAMAVFCFGSVFLSLETFELPYQFLLLGSQLAVLVRRRQEAERLGLIPSPDGA